MHAYTCWCACLPRKVQLQYIFFISNAKPLLQTTDLGKRNWILVSNDGHIQMELINGQAWPANIHY